MRRTLGTTVTMLLFGLVPAAALAQAQAEALKLATLPQPTQLHAVTTSEQPQAAAFTADGGSVVVSHLGKLTVLEAKTGKSEEVKVPRSYYHIRLSPDGATFAATRSAGKGYELQLFEVGHVSPKLRTPIKETGHFAHPLTFSADGRRVAITDNKAITIFDTTTGKSVGTVGGRRVEAVLSPAGKLAVHTSDGDRDPERDWVLTDIATGKDRCKLTSFGRPSFRPDGSAVVTIERPKPKAGKDGKKPAGPVTVFSFTATFRDLTGVATKTIRVFEELPEERIPPSERAFAAQSSFSPDGKTLVVQLQNPTRGGLVLLDADTGRPRAFVPNQQPDKRPYDFECWAFSPDGRTLATSVRRTGEKVGSDRPPRTVRDKIEDGGGMTYLWDLTDLRAPEKKE
ncbi:MAG TPA: hypothetical protein VMZ71_13020 [Gemmataceae bacterium]|nr:hypothetical protein [Gemmataceae bacterium]